MKLLIGVLVILLLMLQYKLWFAESGFPEAYRLEKELKEQQAENARLLERNRALQAEVMDLKQGLESVEQHAREDLGMIKDDETFIHIIQDSTDEKK